MTLGHVLRFFRKSWAALLVLGWLALVVFVHRAGDHLVVRIPYTYLGDEPHYLVTINSILWDGDVELSNNYQRSILGKADAGVHRASQILDHHTYVHTFTGFVHQQNQLFGAFNDPPDRDAAGRLRPRPITIPKSGALPIEYSWHPSYQFFPLAPFLSLLPRTAVEPVLIGLLAAFTFLAALRFRELCLLLAPSRLYADLAMLAVFIGTPVLYYSRALFPESVFVILVVFALHACIARGSWLAAGVYLMFAASLKPPAALLAVPVILIVAGTRLWQAIAVFLLVCLGAGFSFFELRVLKGVLQQGTVVDADRLIQLESLTFQPYNNLFGAGYGLFTFSPVLAVALVGWVPLARRFPREAGAVLAGVVLHLAFLCVVPFFGSSYAGRYQVPALPLIGLGFAGLWFYRASLRRLAWVAFGVLFVISAFINLKGTLWAT
jgi:hypothetical protein